MDDAGAIIGSLLAIAFAAAVLKAWKQWHDERHPACWGGAREDRHARTGGDWWAVRR